MKKKHFTVNTPQTNESSCSVIDNAINSNSSMGSEIVKQVSTILSDSSVLQNSIFSQLPTNEISGEFPVSDKTENQSHIATASGVPKNSVEQTTIQEIVEATLKATKNYSLSGENSTPPLPVEDITTEPKTYDLNLSFELNNFVTLELS